MKWQQYRKLLESYNTRTSLTQMSKKKIDGR